MNLENEENRQTQVARAVATLCNLLDKWSPEIEAAIQEHPTADVFFEKLSAKVCDVGQGPDLAIELLALLQEMAEEDRQAARVMGRLIVSPQRKKAAEPGNADETTVLLILRLLSLWEFDNRRKNVQSESVGKEVRRAITEIISATAAFKRATARDLARLSAVDLHTLRRLITEAETIQAVALLGLKDGDKITVGGVNRFLAENAGNSFDDDKKLKVTRLVQAFRQANKSYALYIKHDQQFVECSLDTMNHATKPRRLFRVRSAGDQRALWKRDPLPELQFRKND